MARRASLGVAIARMFVAHCVAYPVALAWWVACMSIAIWLRRDALLDLENDVAAVNRLIVVSTAPYAIGAFVLTHVLAIKWSFGAESGTGRRFFWIATAVLTGAAILLGAAGWIRIFTH